MSAAGDQIQQRLDKLNDLKSQVQAGKLSLTDFQSQAAPLVKEAAQITGQNASQGSKVASEVNPIWQQFTQQGFVTARAGQWVPILPFSQQEYAKLPNNVLPTQSDIQQGIFDPTTAPMQRIQNGGTGIAPPTSSPGTANNPYLNIAPPPGNQPAGQPAPQPNPPQSGNQPLPTITPSIPAGVNTQTDQGQIALQGAQNAAALQDALNKQYSVNQQAVGQLGQSIQGIPDVLRQEGTSEQNQLQSLADSQKSARAQSLTDLGGVLAQNQMNQFNAAIPDLAEQANTAGIYRSTGFGNILAQKYAQLTANTQNQLAQQGISDREAYLGAQQNALQQQLGFSGQAANAQTSGMQTVGSANAGALQAYGSGLGDVANAQIGMQNAGLQRQFSLSDYTTQFNNAMNLANAARTQGPSGKASPGTQAGVQTGLALLNTGVKAYQAGSGGSGKGA